MAFLERLEQQWFPDSEDEVRWSQDSRAHIRIPARVGRALVKSALALLKTTYRIFSSLTLKRTVLREWYKFTYTVFLAPCIPIAIALGASDQNALATFAIAFLGLLSASGLYRHESEKFVFSDHISSKIRLAWSLTFEAFSIDDEVAIIALCQGRLDLLRGYIVGKIVSTLLLSLGVSFVASGIGRGFCHYNEAAASTLCGLLLAATAAVGLAAGMSAMSPASLLPVSRGAALVLLEVYVIYVFFRRRTHHYLFDTSFYERIDEIAQLAPDETGDKDEYDWATAVVTMCAALILAFFCGRYMLLAATEIDLMQDAFLGYFLLPLISSLVDMPKSYYIGRNVYMDIALELAAGTSVQTAFCIGPLLLILAWILNEPLGYSLSIFEYSSLFGSIWVFSFLVSLGKSHWLSGMQCIGLYLIQVLAMYLYTRS